MRRRWRLTRGRWAVDGTIVLAVRRDNWFSYFVGAVGQCLIPIQSFVSLLDIPDFQRLFLYCFGTIRARNPIRGCPGFNLWSYWEMPSLVGDLRSNSVLLTMVFPYSLFRENHWHGLRGAFIRSMNEIKLEALFMKLTFLALVVSGGIGKADAASKTWLGGASGNANDWNTASNWNPTGVPTGQDDATIPAALQFYPVLTTAASVHNLTINSGGYLAINSGGNLPVSGNPKVNGTLTIAGGSLLASAGNLALAGVLNLTGGTLAIHDLNGGGTATISGGLLQVSHDLAGTGTTSLTGGTLQVGHDFKPIPSKFSDTGGTVEWTGTGGAGAFPAGTYRFFNVVIDSGVNPGFDNQANIIEVAGDWTDNGLATLTRRATTVTFNGATAQNIGGSALTTFNNLTINNGAGVTLGVSATVNATLALTGGVLATGGNQIVLAGGGSVSGGSSGSYVNGSLRKAFVVGAGQLFTFPVGDASNYTPISLSSLNVTTAGTLTGKTTLGEHPRISCSGINPAKDVNRYWTLAPAGIVATSYAVSFTFVAGDVDAGADTANFVVERYGSNWSATAPGMSAANYTSTAGLATFGDFAAGERALVTVASCCQTPDRHALLSLFGRPDLDYTIQASTNLANWTNIGTATCDANGACQFEDSDAPNFPQRFYRAVQP